MPDPVPRLHGREDELAALGRALERAESGRLALVTLEGEPGIGKTRLLDAGLDAARARGARVVTGRAGELDGGRPFGLWCDALRWTPSSADPARASIATLLAPRPTAPGPITVSSDVGLQYRVVDALVDLVEELAHPNPLVIGLDDLQWADPSSLVTVASLVRRLTHASVAVIGCLRPVPRGPELAQLLAALHEAGACMLELDELSEAAVLDLASDVLRVSPRGTVRAGLSSAGGNPLYVTELASALAREGAEPPSTLRAPSLRLTILRHVSVLPGPTVDVLRSAAILGSRFSVVDLSTTTGRSVHDLSAALEPAIRARVLVDDADRLRFRHDLIHDAVYTDSATSVRRGLHVEAGRRLAETGAPALQVAEHFTRGASPGDTAAVDWLTRAARDAAPRSPAVAAGLLQRAIELVADTDPGRGRLRAEWASSLWQAGRLPDAEAACRALLRDSPDPDVERQVRTCLGRTLITQGRMPEALLELDHVRPDSSPPVDRAAARGWASVALGSMGDLDGAADAAEEAGTGAAAASSPTDHTTVSLALNSLAAVAEHRGDPCRGLRVIDDAVLRADRSPERAGHRYPVHVTRGHILMELDRLPDARTTLETGRRISEELGTRWALPSYETFLAVERFLAGAWDDAIAGVETAIEAAAETGERYSLVLGYVVLAVIALHRGDLLQAREMAEAAGREVADGGPRFRGHWLPWVDALLSDAEGDTTRAVDLLGEAWDDCARQGLVIEHPVLGPDLVRLALAVGDRNRAEQVTSAMQGPADDGTTPDRYRGAVLRCRGLVDADPSLLLAAVDAYGRCARPLELALAVEDAAVLLTGQGDTDAARTLTERALDAFERLEAARGVARSEARLRGLGVHRGRRGPRGRPRTGWDSLTTTERTVVDLVAEGLSNPQIGERLFLSRRTVQTHVAHIFAKVSVSSRAQLAAAHAARARPSEQS